ncbi:MAG TPA: hypothetical protein VM324_07420 [Egibacteraceae bacterium]|jgi:hypothetical protein|nr:hypothetical protein [Egibacteraceae bacterium]
MDEREPGTHAALVEQLRDSVARLRLDLEARTDPLLEEVAHALELVIELNAHVHDHALANRERIERLESGS